MLVNRFKFNLQMFAEGEEPTDPVGGSEPNGAEGNEPPVDNKPFATFADEESFKKRLAREAKRGMKSMLETYGLESEEQLKSIIEGKRAEEDAKKSELDKALEKVAKLESDNAKLIADATSNAKNSLAKATATELGVKPERIDYLLKLVDLDSVEFTDGKFDTEGLTAKITEVLEVMPEFKNIQQISKGGTDFNDNASDKKPLLTKEMISKMSASEIASRIEEVREVLSK